MVSVPFCSLKYAHDQVKPEVDAALDRVYKRGQFILGSEVQEFEQEYARFSKVKYCVSMASGLDALYASLHLSGIGKGDEVLVPAHTYIATWLAISRVGAKIVPVDVRSDDRLMDIEQVRASITKKTKALMPVHLYGAACHMSQLVAVAEQHQLKMVEDNAQAHGATWNDQMTGSFGTCNATSFYPTKNLGALGDGGAITTNNETIYQEALRFRNYGSSEQFVNPAMGINSRLDELQAALLRVKLRYLREWNDKRRDIANIYSNRLKGVGDLILPVSRNEAKDVFHLYVVQTHHREKLRSYLFQKGIGTMVHYPIPPHLQGAYRELGYRKGQFPVSEQLAQTVLSLPIWPGLGPDEIEWVVEHIKKFYDAV